MVTLTTDGMSLNPPRSIEASEKGPKQTKSLDKYSSNIHKKYFCIKVISDDNVKGSLKIIGLESFYIYCGCLFGDALPVMVKSTISPLVACLISPLPNH